MSGAMFSRFILGNRSLGYLALLIAASSGPAYAQVLVAGDDSYDVSHGQALVIEAFGVLDNDTLDGEAAGENGATAELITDASHGTLALGSDGSFTYSPGASFDGTDTFVYRAVFGSVSDPATVTLTACAGGPQIFTCWKRGAFLAKAAALGHPSFTEGFEEDAAWGLARSPDTIPSVSSRGFEWRANDFDPTHTDPPQPPPLLPPITSRRAPAPRELVSGVSMIANTATRRVRPLSATSTTHQLTASSTTASPSSAIQARAPSTVRVASLTEPMAPTSQLSSTAIGRIRSQV
jgi:hypothetical protein